MDAMSFIKSGRSERRKFEADGQKNYDMLFKIVLTGDPNSGKSRILQHFIKGYSSD